MKHRIQRFFAPLLILLVGSVGAERATAQIPPICSSRSMANSCMFLTEIQKAVVSHCERDKRENDCDAFTQSYLKENPDGQGRMRNCEVIATCDMPRKLEAYVKACLANWGAAWADFGTSTLKFLFTNQRLSPEIKAREEFFQNCVSAECKREMLGPYASLFTKEEIEGHPERRDLNSRDTVNQTYLQGFSAAVLYRKLLERMKSASRDLMLDDPFLEPWSGQEPKRQKPVSRMIDDFLIEIGVEKAACFDPIVVAEMRCYAAFAVLDPLLAMGAATKIGRVTGAIKTVGKRLNKTFRPAATARAEAETTATKHLGFKPTLKLEPPHNEPVAGSQAGQLVAYDRDGVSFAQFSYTIESDGRTAELDIYVNKDKRNKRVSELLFAEFLERNPNITRVEATLSSDNSKAFQKAVDAGMDCEAAFRSTPAYRMRARFGFTKIIAADCRFQRFTVERE